MANVTSEHTRANLFTVKTFHLRKGESPEMPKQRVNDEFRTALQIRPCPYIAQVLGISCTDTSANLVMAFYGVQYHGKWRSLTLSAAMKDDWKQLMPWHDLVREVANGLAVIHEAGYYHGDLKGMLFYFIQHIH